MSKGCAIPIFLAINSKASSSVLNSLDSYKLMNKSSYSFSSEINLAISWSLINPKLLSQQ